MRTIYLDLEFICHVSDDGTMLAVDTDVFDDKCDAFIEGYRFIPAGYEWVRSDGEVFTGEMVSPIKDCDILDTVQGLYLETKKSYDGSKERIATLEEENAMLMECILEMSEIVYA